MFYIIECIILWPVGKKFSCNCFLIIVISFSLSPFLIVFAKLRKATVSLVMCHRPLVRMLQLGSHWMDFHEILYLSTFRKYGEPGSVDGVATGYGLDGPGIESRWGGEIFRTCPDRPWGPPSLLYNGYRVFPGGK